MSDVPKTKLAIVAASVAVVCSVFGIKSVAEKINGIAEWIDQKIDHGKMRESIGNGVEAVANIAAWELVLGWELTKELSGMN